jgi:signal transduction histidine kinase/DNA-binding response OmpR family regulator
LFIAGLNPHRPLDAAYRDFIGLFVGQIAASLANAHAHEEEQRRASALAELDRAKTAFFGNVSHEFRTPLTLMLGPLVELAKDPRLADDMNEQLTLVHRNGLRLLKLVNTMLDFSRIEAGRGEANFEAVDLAELTADLASSFRSATQAAGLRLVIDCPPVGQAVLVDRDMWEKIVLNLVSNAFKFTMTGQIAVTLQRREAQVVLVVADTGLGIPQAELPRLFERFHRVAGARGRTHEGTGIGLALVHELVKLQGGTVAITSELEVGTTVTVTLPLDAAHAGSIKREPVASERAVAFLEEARRWLPAARDEPVPAPALAADLRSGRIVLADDNADMRAYIVRLLGGRWEVEAVGNGVEALAAVRRRRPDLVITDVMMPELDGFGLLAALRGDEGLRDLPVLMLSARAGDDARVHGLEAGANDYLVKPFSARELTARVEVLVLRERIRSVEEAQARRQARVFAQAPVGIAILRGPTHVFESANGPYRELVGGVPLIGMPVREALPYLKDQGVYELLDAVFATREPYVGRSFGVMVDRRPGQPPDECFFDFVYQPLFDDAGEVEGIAAVIFEVTELTRARREADAANRAKDEFLAMLGHELRNPLAPIVTALQLMQMRDTSGGREREIIERQVRHMIGLVDDLLDVSRITQGKIALKRERVELARVVTQAIEMASPLLEQQGHTLAVEVTGEGLALDGDPARLAQVVANLLTNAAKYTRPGGHITVTGIREGERVTLRVRDTGIGIAPEVLPRIFEPFTQAAQAIDRSQGGLGLGLAIVRSLVKMHGGEVTANSAGRDLGTEFVVRLPAGAPEPSTRIEAEASGQFAATKERSVQAIRVLVVDDNEDAAEMLADMLEIFGHVARCAHEGATALRIAETFDPDVAVLDIGLPGMDGFQLAQHFQGHPQLRRTRLIAVTGYGEDRDRARSAAAGFVAHLVKPVDMDRLNAVIAGGTM